MRATIRTILLGATCAIALSACGTIGGTAPHMGRIEAMQDKTTLATPVKVPEPLAANVNEAKRSLTTVARLAASTNPAVKEARFGFASQSLGPAQAGLVYLPTLGLSGQVGGTDNQGITSYGRNHSAGLNFAWTLFDGGAGDHRVNREKWRAYAAVATISERQEIVILSSIMEALDVSRQREQINSADKAQIADMQEAVRIATELKQAGTGSDVDIGQARTELLNAQARLSQDEQLLRDAGSKYRRFVGEEVPASFEIGTPPAVPRDVREAKMAAERHPSIRIVEGEIQGNIADALAIRTEGVSPKLSINLAGLGIASIATAGGGALLTAGNAVLQAALPLLDGGENNLRLARSIASLEVALSRREEIGRVIDSAVEQAHSAHVAAMQGEDLAIAKRRTAEQVKIGALADYRAGRRALSEVLKATNDLHQARREEINAKWSRVYASYRVKAAQGALGDFLQAHSYKEVMIDGKTDPFSVSNLLKPDSATAE